MGQQQLLNTLELMRLYFTNKNPYISLTMQAYDISQLKSDLQTKLVDNECLHVWEVTVLPGNDVIAIH